jgi:hypothetical protein
VNTFASRAGRLRPVVLFLTAIVAAACADDQSITSPLPNASKPQPAATADGASELTDAPVVTIDPARTGVIRTIGGFVELTGTVTCPAGLPAHIVAYLEQYDRKTNHSVSGFGEVYVACVGTPTTWYAPVTMVAGEPLPQRGRADVLFRYSVPGASTLEMKRSVRLVEDLLN